MNGLAQDLIGVGICFAIHMGMYKCLGFERVVVFLLTVIFWRMK